MSELPWGFILAAYLFIGGMAGGAYIVSGLADLLGKGRHKELSKSGAYMSLILIIVGLVLLVFDLGRFTVDPLGALNSYIHFPTSIMTVGTWIITGFTVMALVTSLLWMLDGAVWVRKIVEVFGIILGFSTSAYTGLLLSFARGVPVWGSPFLPWLFVFSGTLTGLAISLFMIPVFGWLMPRLFGEFKMLCGDRKGMATMICYFERFGFIVIGLEIIALLIYIGTTSMTSIYWTSSAVNIWFFAYILLGLLIPVGINLYNTALEHSKSYKAITYLAIASQALVLLGGLLLRYVILIGGQLAV